MRLLDGPMLNYSCPRFDTRPRESFAKQASFDVKGTVKTLNTTLLELPT